MVQDLNTPGAEKGFQAETNLFEPTLSETSRGSDQEMKLVSPHSYEASDPQMNASDPLVFVDFLTGENGDSIDCDDILIGHGIGLNRQSIFEDGFLSFAQKGNDSLLYFDSDGFNHQDNDKVALVIFKDVQAANFSEHNLSSRIINNDDFLLSQDKQSSLNSNLATEAATQVLETDPMLMSPGLQSPNDQLDPFTTNPAIPGSETNPVLPNSDLHPSIQLV